LGDVALFKSSEESNGGGTPLLFCLSISSVWWIYWIQEYYCDCERLRERERERERKRKEKKEKKNERVKRNIDLQIFNESS
jgi:hypothetical protein